jgi:hypothetical protein
MCGGFGGVGGFGGRGGSGAFGGHGGRGGMPFSIFPGRPGLPPRIELSWAIAYSLSVEDLLIDLPASGVILVGEKLGFSGVRWCSLRLSFVSEVLLFWVDLARRGIPDLAGRDAGQSDISRTPLHSLRPDGLRLPPVAFLVPRSD